MIEQLLLETFLGGLTGYVTNDVAIKGLFKKGGVVEQTRREFIHQASALLEEQVLTSEVLRERLSLSAVEAALDELLRDFFLCKLPEVLAAYRLGDVPGYEAVVDQATKRLLAVWHKEQPSLAVILGQRLSLAELLDKKQQDQLTEQLLAVVTEELRQGRYGERLVRKWLDSAGELNGEQLGLTALVNEAAAQLVRRSRRWLAELAAGYGSAMNELLLDAMERLDIRGLLAVVEGELKQRPLRDYITAQPAELAVLLAQVLESDQGLRLCDLIAARLVAMAAQMDRPMGEYLDRETRELLQPFVTEQLPKLVESVVQWLWVNEQALNGLIEEAVDETAAEVGSLQGMALQMVKESVLQGLFAEHTIILKVDGFLQQSIDHEEITELVLQWLAEYSGRMSLASLVELLGGEQGPLRRIVRDMLRAGGLRFMQEGLEPYVAALLDKPLGQLVTVELAERYGRQLEQAAATYLVDQLEGEALSQAMEGAVQKLAQDFAVRPLAEVVTGYDQKKGAWAAQGQQVLERYAEQLRLPLDHWIADFDEERFVVQLLEVGERRLPEQLERLGRHWQAKPLVDVYSSVFTGQWVEDMLPACRRFIQDKLVEAASGNLSQMAEHSLNQLSNEAILTLVQDFMGRELRPLNYLGAALGGMVGIVTGALTAGSLGAMTVGSAGSMAGLVAGKSFIYGAVGYGTNCAAIKGLFWPYKPVAGVRMLQGVVPKQQERFADSLGRMVDRYVLNEDILQEILVGQNERWQAMGTALGNDPVVAADVLSKIIGEQDKILSGSYRGLLNKAGRLLPDWLGRQSKRELAQMLPLEKLAVSVDQVRLGEKCRQEGAKWCRSHHKVTEYITAEGVMIHAGSFLHRQVPRLLQAQPSVEAKTYDRWQEQSVAEALPVAVMEQFGRWLSVRVEQLWSSRTLAQTVAGGVNGFLGQQSLGEAFDGRFSDWVEENISRLLQTVINGMIHYLAVHQEVITGLVQEQIKTQLSFVQLMGYMTVGGDELVADVVQRLVTVKLPLFLAIKQQEVGNILLSYWQEQLAPMSPQELRLSVSAEVVSEVLCQIGEAPVVQEQLSGLVNDGVKWLSAFPLKGLLSPTVLAQWPLMEQAFAGELSKAREHLLEHWQRNGQEIMRCGAQVLTPFIQRQLEQLTVGDLLSPCASVLEQETDISRLLDLGEWDGLIRQLLEGVLLRAGQVPMEQWLDWPQFSQALTAQADDLLACEEFRQWWERMLAKQLEQAANIWEDLLPNVTRDQLVSWIVQGFLLSLRQEGSSVLREMNLSQVTSVQVQAMDAKELEQLVHGFAQQYFSHIQNMGWLGAGFAIPGLLINWFLWL